LLLLVGGHSRIVGSRTRRRKDSESQPCEHLFVTSQGSAHGRFTRAIQQRNLWAAEASLRELGSASLKDALGYLDLPAEQKPEKFERAAVRWHGRLETEATFLSLAESQLALAALASLCAGERDAVQVLRRLLRAHAA
jgi:hypothetical protein